ncbi:MAG: T9SS type A sorting domain-containing protein [Bacteroidota bacterium]
MTTARLSHMGVGLALLLGLTAPLAHGQVRIEWTSGPAFYVSPNAIQGQYVSYRITNVSSTQGYTDVWAEISDLTGSSVQLAPNESPFFWVGTLGPEESKGVFFYLEGTGTTETVQPHTLTIYEGDPSDGVAIGRDLFAYTHVEESDPTTLSEITDVYLVNASPTLGATFELHVEGTTGHMGRDRAGLLSPAGRLDWPAEAFELVETSIAFSGGNTATWTNTLGAAFARRPTTDYHATYTFRVKGPNLKAAPICPVSHFSSGIHTRHDPLVCTGGSGIAPVNLPVTESYVYLNHIAATDILPNGGAVGFTATVRNASSSQAATLDGFTVDLPRFPAGATYVPGSTQLDGVAWREPSITGTTLYWPGPLPVAARGSAVVTYRLNLPPTQGTYDVEATGRIGTLQIDRTTNISDDRPAVASVFVGNVADLELDVRVNAPTVTVGREVTFSVDVSNRNGSDASGVQVSNPLSNLPNGIALKQINPERGSYDTASGLWNVGTVQQGETVTFDFTVEVMADGAYTGCAEIASSSPTDPDSTPYDGIRQDDLACATTTTQGATPGNDAGLESNGRLAGKLAHRYYQRSQQPHASKGGLGLHRFSPSSAQDDPHAPQQGLLDLIPEAGPESALAFVTTPDALVPVTNASAVFAVDYLATETDRLAALFTATTEAGSVYEHTKVICDRLTGATLRDLEIVEIEGLSFLMARLHYPSGAVDYSISFIATEEAGRFQIESQYLGFEYTPPAGEQVYNFQVWSVSRAYTIDLVREVLDRMAAQKAVLAEADAPSIPSVYLRQGTYANGQLHLDVVNPHGAKELRILGGTLGETETTERTGFERTFALPPSVHPDSTVRVTLDVGPIFDIAFFVGNDLDESLDQVYFADGPWGAVPIREGATIDRFDVATSDAAPEPQHRPVERDVQVSGTGGASVFRLLKPSARTADLSAYDYLAFTASGQGAVRLVAEQAQFAGEAPFSVTFDLTEQPETIQLPFSLFERPGSADTFSPEDLVSLTFFVDGGEGEPFALGLGDVHFGTDGFTSTHTEATEMPEVVTLEANYPNPFNPTTVIGYTLPKASPVHLAVYDVQGRLVALLRDEVQAAGAYTVRFDALDLAGGHYLYRLRTNTAVLTRGMTLVK